MKIVLVGLGVIGGSFAMSLHENGYHDLHAIDPNQESINTAVKSGLIRSGFKDGSEILPKADLVIFAVYPSMIKAFIQKHRAFFKNGSLLTDVTGVKQHLIKQIVPLLPKEVDFVFGHPMAGSEKKGLIGANSSLFKGANYLITPIPINTEAHLTAIEKLVKQIGFKRITRVTPAFHDEMIGFTSQLPHAMAVALVNSDKEKRDTGNFVGDSYRDLTRIAAINEELWSELFIENKNPLIEAIERFELELGKIKKTLQENDEQSLKELFRSSAKRRNELL